MRLEWSAAALADLDRFAVFLQEHHPDLAALVAREIIARAKVLTEQPRLGRPIAGREEYRQVSLRILKAIYVFQWTVTASSC